MKIIRKINTLRRLIKKVKQDKKTIGFVPTMGALHEGHLKLIQQARKENDFVVVSIFVNPTQFGPKEDFKKYPRNLKQDAFLCRKEGVDVIFYPDIKQMYPEGFKTYVKVNDLSNLLCGRFRPGHFRGVTTVVTKLFNIVNPDLAYFGQKDAQQAIIIKRMVLDLNIPIKIKVIPIVRDKDGLALSSRNVYLNPQERKDAVILYQSLRLAKKMVKAGILETKKIIKKIKQLIHTKKTARIQYISIVDLENLKPISRIKDKGLLAMAVYIGDTRLIDNTILKNPKA
ncbi:MAG: pantoate--beta-alanine ligase [Candidatus Omnitrophica bacterium]|nr:pantoate--beta-alanine ligase [Candidatus Omnitrophota bacterium]